MPVLAHLVAANEDIPEEAILEALERHVDSYVLAERPLAAGRRAWTKQHQAPPRYPENKTIQTVKKNL